MTTSTAPESSTAALESTTDQLFSTTIALDTSEQLETTTEPQVTTSSPSSITSTTGDDTTVEATSTTTMQETTSEPVCPDFGVTDLVFVLDSSGSLGVDNWSSMKDFVSAIVGKVPVSEFQTRFDRFYYCLI
jgi:hypothetical protein